MSGGGAGSKLAEPLLVSAVCSSGRHFWTWHCSYRDDYTRADVPMLPTKVTPHQAA